MDLRASPSDHPKFSILLSVANRRQLAKTGGDWQRLAACPASRLTRFWPLPAPWHMLSDPQRRYYLLS